MKRVEAKKIIKVNYRQTNGHPLYPSKYSSSKQFTFSCKTYSAGGAEGTPQTL